MKTEEYEPSFYNLPPLIDMHVHTRDMGQEHKETFLTVSKAAIAGGFHYIVGMPNLSLPHPEDPSRKEGIFRHSQLRECLLKAAGEAICNISFYAGSIGGNYGELREMYDEVPGLKLYLDATTGGYNVTDESVVREIMEKWGSHVLPGEEKPILLHAEGGTIDMALRLARETMKKVHICHVDTAEVLGKIIKAKEEGINVTCGVTPHHLFLTKGAVDEKGPYAMMKPPLATQEDVDFLWDNLGYIDVIESDHAPHTKAEKDSPNPPFGVPGLETTLPLMLTAVKQGRLTIERLTELISTTPARILGIHLDPNSWTKVDLNKTYTIQNADLYTKCGWSPFDGMEVTGQVEEVVIKGRPVYTGGNFIQN